MNNDAYLLLGALVGAGVPLLLVWLFRLIARPVLPGESLLVVRFGKVVARHDTPGLHLVPDAPLPWVQTVTISRRIKAALVRDVEVHDIGGSEAHVDVLVEFAVTDPVQATYAIDDVDAALAHVVSHAAITVLGSRPLAAAMRDSGELGAAIRAEVSAEAESWGLVVHQVLLRSVRPSSRVMEQILGELAARLDKTKARVEEEGRQAVELLHARTSAEIAREIGRARSQYLLGVGNAYAQMKAKPAVHAAWKELHDLVQLRPESTVAFRGFGPDAMRIGEVAMLDAPGMQGGNHHSPSPPRA